MTGRINRRPIALAVDIGGTSIKVGLIRRDGKLLALERQATPAKAPPDTVIHQTLSLCRRLSADHSIDLAEIDGAGFSIAGFVTAEGVVTATAHLSREWVGFDLHARLLRELETDYYFALDTPAPTLGEAYYGAGRGHENFAYVTVNPAHILDSDEALSNYSYDWWPIAAKWRQQGKRLYHPEAIFRPTSVEEISRLLQWAGQHRIAITPWGAGSGVTGAAIPLQGGITLDMGAMQRILALDEMNMLVRVQAGMMGHLLEQALNERGYTLNHSPQSLERSTVGGWVATRATGQFSARWGGIEHLVAALTIVPPSGDIIETALRPRTATGPDLAQMFIGSEGVLGVVADVTLRIFPLPEHRAYETLVFPTVASGLNAMRRIMQVGLRPFLVRFYDADEARHLMGLEQAPGNIMLLGCEGIRAVAEAEQDACLAICREEQGEAVGPQTALNWMERRFDFSLIEGFINQPGGLAETIEIAQFWSDIHATYSALKSALSPLADEVLGHFSHVYPQGTSLYMIMLGRVGDAAQAEERLLSIWETAMTICLERGATISHHHGVGLARLPYIEEELGSSFKALQRIKQAFDPAGILNPGKLRLSEQA